MSKKISNVNKSGLPNDMVENRATAVHILEKSSGFFLYGITGETAGKQKVEAMMASVSLDDLASIARLVVSELINKNAGELLYAILKECVIFPSGGYAFESTLLSLAKKDIFNALNKPFSLLTGGKKGGEIMSDGIKTKGGNTEKTLAWVNIYKDRIGTYAYPNDETARANSYKDRVQGICLAVRLNKDGKPEAFIKDVDNSPGEVDYNKPSAINNIPAPNEANA